MIKLCKLPYPKTALEPHISAETFNYHHGKHHKAYVDKVNKLTDGTGLAGKPVEDIIVASRGKSETELFNQAAQVWNHGFYWSSLSPDGGKPTAELGAAINAAFGSLKDFKAALKEEATGHFASGWAWVVAEDGVISIQTTDDADTMVGTESTPLLVIDVWEHAYYLDHQNERKAYVGAVVDKLLNWEFASANFAADEMWRYPG